MKDSLRQSMAWLHTWAGLLLGWLLFVMFACGTTAYFREEITRWMQPELHGSADPTTAAIGAMDWLDTHAPDATRIYITLPDKRSVVTRLSWSLPDTASPDRPTSAQLDPQGKTAAVRETAGGYFLYRLHYDMHYIPYIWARYTVGLAAMMMFVAIISGIITHKKIFADFFLLRFGKGQRSWLDAHNVTAVLALPFHLMITYTGLVSLQVQLSPAPIAAVYQDEASYYDATAPRDTSVTDNLRPAQMAPISGMIAAARNQWGGREVGVIAIRNAGSASARITLSSAEDRTVNARAETLLFDGVSGKIIAAGPSNGPARTAEGVMIGVHAGRFANLPLRWLYFISGLFGTAMVGTGLILWSIKRRSRLADPDRPHLGFRIVERLNIAVIAGFPAGLAGYFLSNRLLPASMSDRIVWEAHSLFLTWLALACLALIGPSRQAWRNLAAAGAILFGAVPLVSGWTTTRGLPASIAQGNSTFIAFDLVMLAMAFIYGFAWTRLRQGQIMMASQTLNRKAKLS